MPDTYDSYADYREDLLQYRDKLSNIREQLAQLNPNDPHAVSEFFCDSQVEQQLENTLTALNGIGENYVEWGAYERPSIRWLRNKDLYDVLSRFFFKKGDFDPDAFGAMLWDSLFDEGFSWKSTISTSGLLLHIIHHYADWFSCFDGRDAIMSACLDKLTHVPPRWHSKLARLLELEDSMSKITIEVSEFFQFLKSQAACDFYIGQGGRVCVSPAHINAMRRYANGE